MDPLGTQLRRARRRLGLTLDELAGRAGISKPYLSLIENSRVTNPPSDEKLRRLEQVLGFPSGELLHQAHLHRTPKDIRAVLAQLAQGQGLAAVESAPATMAAVFDANSKKQTQRAPKPNGINTLAAEGVRKGLVAAGVDLDAAYLSGVLHELVEQSAGNVEQVRMNAIPIVNRVSAGYPRDFTDLSYPRGVADDFIGCPGIADPDAFAARVFGDSMRPKYTEGDIVIFSPAAPTRDGDDCFVRFEDGQTTFKRVFFEPDDTGQAILRLQPRNEKYRPQLVRSDQITGVYRAMYRYQSVEEDVKPSPPREASPLQRRGATASPTRPEAGTRNHNACGQDAHSTAENPSESRVCQSVSDTG